MTAIASLPELLVRVDGAALNEGERRPLSALRIRQRLSVPTQAELTFVDPPSTFDVGRRLQPGTQLQVGLAADGTALFEGETTVVEHVYEGDRGVVVRVRAYDLLHRLRKRQQVRTFAQLTPAELAEQLAGAVGLDVDVAESGPRWPQITQHAQSDLELLQEVTARAGLFFTVHDGALHLITLEGAGDEIRLELGRNLWQARTEVNAERAARRVVALGWDPRRIDVHREEAGDARTSRDVGASVTATQVGGSDERVLAHVGAPTADLTRGEAQAELDVRSAGEVTLWGVAEGDHRIRPGTPVRVDDTAPGLAGRYVVTSATHTVGEPGFLTEFSTEPTRDRRTDRPAALAPGRVVDVDDPEQLGRVKVHLPTFDDAPTEWLQVVLSGAGAGKGLVALPDVDDRVLVALPHGDPARGVVVGGLYGSEPAPDAGVQDGRVRRYTFTTRAGQRIVLDETADRVRVQNAAGSFVELTPDQVRLHAACDLLIEAPGKRITVVADAIDLERG
ncbi:MAG: type IV secretion protein Rhs [Actinobacteria bacterium]|nr:type IV secretion protein Rhs [Actinomycetota bacterium]